MPVIINDNRTQSLVMFSKMKRGSFFYNGTMLCQKIACVEEPTEANAIAVADGGFIYVNPSDSFEEVEVRIDVRSKSEVPF